MTTSHDLFRVTRENVLKLIDGITLDQLNKIPNGFTGNMAWHIGHLVATEQGLLYRLSGNPSNLDQSFVDKYKKGSVPQVPIDEKELNYIKERLAAQPSELTRDVETGIFKTYTQYTTSYGNTIHSFEEALTFVNVHEGLHLGYLMALKRAVLAG